MPDPILSALSKSVPVDARTAFADSVELLRAMASGQLNQERVVKFHRPGPTLAMSRWESGRKGFAEASEFALSRGFAPTIRPTGGRAAVYDSTCVVFDLVVKDRGSVGPGPLFADTADRLAGALRSLGVDARVGAVPGEYCPGDYSVNAGGRTKLVGTSQRAVRGARLLSGMIPLGDFEHLVPVLDRANRALALEWNHRTFGSLAREVDGIDPFELVSRLQAALVCVHR